MPRVSAAFFLTGGLFVLVGMFGGVWMGMTEDFRLAPAHAHLNLLGWVTMALYGTFYALTARTMSKRLAWANYIVATLGVVVMIPSLAFFLLGRDAGLIPLMGAGELLTVSGLVLFLVSAVREVLRKRDETSVPASSDATYRIAAE